VPGMPGRGHLDHPARALAVAHDPGCTGARADRLTLGGLGKGLVLLSLVGGLAFQLGPVIGALRAGVLVVGIGHHSTSFSPAGAGLISLRKMLSAASRCIGREPGLKAKTTTPRKKITSARSTQLSASSRRKEYLSMTHLSDLDQVRR